MQNHSYDYCAHISSTPLLSFTFFTRIVLLLDRFFFAKLSFAKFRENAILEVSLWEAGSQRCTEIFRWFRYQRNTQFPAILGTQYERQAPGFTLQVGLFFNLIAKNIARTSDWLSDLKTCSAKIIFHRQSSKPKERCHQVSTFSEIDSGVKRKILRNRRWSYTKFRKTEFCGKKRSSSNTMQVKKANLNSGVLDMCAQ